MVTVTRMNGGALVVAVAKAGVKDASDTYRLEPGVNTLTEEVWAKVKTHPTVVAALESGNLVMGLDKTLVKGEEAARLSRPITELNSKQARDLVLTITDKPTLEIWLGQESTKGRRNEVLAAIRNQLRIVGGAIPAAA